MQADLRDVPQLEARLKQCGLDFGCVMALAPDRAHRHRRRHPHSTVLACRAPALLVAECVLVYMPSEHGTALLCWASSAFEHAAFVSYDPMRPDDAFGRMMVHNLKVRSPIRRPASSAFRLTLAQRRGCVLRAIHERKTEEDYRKLYLSNGWEEARVLNMRHVYDAHAEPAERRRRVIDTG